MVEADYPIDPANRTLMGHSWGGVFGLYSLFRDPLLYKNYLICSPDLTVRVMALSSSMRKRMREHMTTLPATLFISQGGREYSRAQPTFGVCS